MPATVDHEIKKWWLHNYDVKESGSRSHEHYSLRKKDNKVSCYDDIGRKSETTDFKNRRSAMNVNVHRLGDICGAEYERRRHDVAASTKREKRISGGRCSQYGVEHLVTTAMTRRVR